MVYASDFIVRKSGIKENNFYIDYRGLYKLSELAEITGLKSGKIEQIYKANGAVYDASHEVYYFPETENAREAIALLIKNVTTDKTGKAVYLTEQEIQYIRQALINEGVNTIKLKNKIKDDIFKKLNET